MINLNIYGWNDRLDQLKQESAYKTLSHGRIAIVHRTCYEVISEDGLFQCELTGNMMFGKSDFELPCTGDWVIFQPFDDSKGIILDMLPRERILFRKKSGTVAGKQAIASYVDKAFIVQSLDDNFNVRRVERFMVQIMEESIKPVLVLNKADLDFDEQKTDEAVKHVASQIYTETAVSTSDNMGRRLENLVFLHLRRKYKHIFYYKDRGECDFITMGKSAVKEAIQVCLIIDDENFEREYNGLVTAMQNLGIKEGNIVTLNQSDTFEKDGMTIRMIPAHLFFQE